MTDYLFTDKNNEKAPDTGKEEEIVHTGSGGAFDGTESLSEETDRDLSDEQLDERLEHTKQPKEKRPPAY
jgi:hypothetical protein